MNEVKKFHVNNAHGSSVMALFRPDGSPAVQGEDYSRWTGEYHKNGPKWSYTEGGIQSRQQVWFLVNQRSSHSGANDRKRIVGLNVGPECRTVEVELCGPWDEQPTQPPCPASVPELVYLAAIALAPAEHRERWAKLTETVRLSINDAYGTRVLGAFLEDGTPAKEGLHYVFWNGAYHKNGKWSYGEGGPAVPFGTTVWFIVNQRSTHSNADNRKRFVGVNVGGPGQTTSASWCGPWSEQPVPPPCPTGVPDAVYQAAVTTLPGEEHRQRWAALGEAVRYEVIGRVMCYVLADGTPAVEGEHYSLWTGAHTKAGKWSTTENGVALKPGQEVWLVIQNGGSHGRERYYRIVSYTTAGEVSLQWCGAWSSLTEEPTNPGVPELVYAGILDATREAREEGMAAARAAAEREVIRQLEEASAQENQAVADAAQAETEELTEVFEQLGQSLASAQYARQIALAATEAVGGDRYEAWSILSEESGAGYGRQRRQDALRQKLKVKDWAEGEPEGVSVLRSFLGLHRDRDFSPILYGAVLWLESQGAKVPPSPKSGPAPSQGGGLLSGLYAAPAQKKKEKKS